jgi:hypothetical protein
VICIENKRGCVKVYFIAKNKAGQLIDIAKHAVEIAIEQNEDVAIKWLQEQTKRGIN